MVTRVPPDTGPYDGRTLFTEISVSDTAKSTYILKLEPRVLTVGNTAYKLCTEDIVNMHRAGELHNFYIYIPQMAL